MKRRPKDRSNWGDRAFKAMHDKPITRDVLQTARELLDDMAEWNRLPDSAEVILAARVEKMLARCAEINRNGEEFPTILTASVELILNGGADHG